MSTEKKKPASAVGKLFLAACVLACLLPLVFAVVVATSRWRSKPNPAPVSDATVFAAYGKSPSCQSCHEEEFKNWRASHHALAERAVDLTLDRTAFDPARSIPHGSQQSAARVADGQLQLVTRGLSGTNQPFAIARVIGVDPLRQYLLPASGGRLQASELCFDPKRLEWFNVYGEEDRQPGEWGHWTGRGMNWNFMCATCHNTRLRKNYDSRTDTYATTMAEMAVGCEACHGPMADHNAWQAKHPNKSGDPTIRKISRPGMFATCGQCHARRAELTGDFQPGENFFDHHHLTIPDETDTFYPDGQVRDEDYEFTAFLGSKMHTAGVRCVDCHEPHTSKLRVPGNLMCLACHGGVAAGVPPAVEPGVPPGGKSVDKSRRLENSSERTGSKMPPSTAGGTPAATLGAPRIDLATHSHHKPDTAGDLCTDCHMPTTVYMQRHPRHDHGFTVPDPRLTQELGIPNACNRCHTNQTPEWSLEAMNKWYGPRTNELMRTRATAIAKARAGDAAAVPALVKMTAGETNFFWRAVAANLLQRWAAETNVTAALLRCAGDTNELVRTAAVRGLEPLAQSGVDRVVKTLNARLADPVRSVRVAAAWALHHTLDTNSPAGADLLAYLRHNADQPSSVMQAGVFLLDRGDAVGALELLRRAVSWDPNSAPLYHALAVAASVQGQSAEAVTALQSACRLAPRDAEYRYKLGLALNEVGRLDEAQAALAEAVKLDPQFARAWYNLGLAYSAQEKIEPALAALLRAESLDARSPQIPYARATILARLGRTDEARRAAQRALELQPGFPGAAELLRALAR